mgnify:CR=1 FL=1
MDWIRRAKPVLGLLAGFLFALLLFSCAGGSNAQNNHKVPMMVSLSVLNISDSSPYTVELEFVLKNNTDHAYDVLKWGTPFESGFNDNLFAVTRNGQKMDYLGRQFKRGAPTRSDFTHMAPRGEVAARIFLNDGYDLTQPGLYTVEYRKPYISMKTDHSDPALVPVRSNRLEIKLGH